MMRSNTLRMKIRMSKSSCPVHIGNGREQDCNNFLHNRVSHLCLLMGNHCKISYSVRQSKSMRGRFFLLSPLLFSFVAIASYHCCPPSRSRLTEKWQSAALDIDVGLHHSSNVHPDAI